MAGSMCSLTRDYEQKVCVPIRYATNPALKLLLLPVDLVNDRCMVQCLVKSEIKDQTGGVRKLDSC